MSINKKTQKRKTEFLDEAKVIGYNEGFFDGRNELIDELVELKLLIKGWKKKYNETTKNNFLIK